MPGAGIEITVDDRKVAAAFRRLRRQTTDMTQVMEEVGAAARTHVDLNFRGEHDPYGSPWEPLAASTVRQRRKGEATGKKDKILRDTGRLAGSATHSGSGPVFGEQSASPDSVVISTDAFYAGFHQHGTKHIPARPFLPFEGYPEDLADEILDILNSHLEKAL